MDPYRKYFNIDPNFFPAVDEKVIKTNPDLWKKFYPHDTFIQLIKDVERVLTRNQKLNIWIEGAYGTGKSYAALTLKHLLDATIDETREYFDDFGLDQDLRNKFISAKQQGKIITVHRYGSSSIHGDNDLFLAIQESIEQALVKEGINTDGYESLKNSIIKYLSDEENKKSFEVYVKGSYRDLFGGDDVDNIIRNLSAYKDLALQTLMGKIFRVANEKQIKAFTLDDEALVNWVEEVINKNDLAALVFIWDEFSEYFDNNKHHLTGFQRLLQLSESAPFCFICVTHRSGEIFVETDSDKSKILGRFVRPVCNIELPENMAFRLMGQALKKQEDDVLIKEWEDILNDLNGRTYNSRKQVQSAVKIDEADLEKILPIHPYTASLLKHIATSFESNQRSMFDFIKNDRGDEIRGFQWFIDNVGPYDDNPLLTIDMLWGYFYDMGKDGLTHKIRMILDYYPRLTATKKLNDNERRVLRTILLFQAISTDTNDSVELFFANEKNLNNAFEGTDLENGAASHCADKLVTDGIIYKKKIKDNNFVYAILTGEIDSNKIDEQKKTYQQKNTPTLIQEGKLEETLELSASMKLRYVIDYAGATDFELKAKKAIATARENQHKMYAVMTFSKDANETALLTKKIHEIMLSNPDSGVIFIDSSKTTLGEDKFAEWVENKATATYYTGKDGDQSKQYSQYANEVLSDWRERIKNGSFVVYTSSTPSGDIKVKAESVSEFLLDEDKKKFNLGLEHYKVHDPLWTSTMLKMGAECGVLQTTKSTYSNQKKLENAFAGAWGVANYWENSPSLSISRIKIDLNEFIEGKMEEDGRIAISEIYGFLKEEPYGFMPCNFTAFVMGFLLKEYVNDKYSWSDDMSSDELTLDKFKEMVDEIIKQDITPNMRYRDKYIVTMTPEQKCFIELTSTGFGIDKSYCSTIEHARECIRSKMKELAFPVWTLIYMLDNVNLTTDNNVLKDIINLYCGVANNNSIDSDKTESDIANEIGAIALKNKGCAKDLQTLINKSNCTRGMKAYIASYKNGELLNIANQIADNGNYINSLKSKFDAEAANWVWKKDTVNQKIDEVICEYKIILETNKVFNGSFRDYDETMQAWNEKCKNMRLSYQTIKNDVGDLDSLLSLLYEYYKNGKLQEHQKNDFVLSIMNYGDDFRDLYSNQFPMFAKVESFYLNGLNPTDIEKIFMRVDSGSFIKDKATYNQKVEQIVTEYKKTLGFQKLKKLWMDKTCTDSPQEWSRKYTMPILAMVADEDVSECRKAFETLSNRNPNDIQVQDAQKYLEDFKYWDDLNNAVKRDKAFMDKIVKEKSVMLNDIDEVKNYLLNHITDYPYEWFGSPVVARKLDEFAQAKYCDGGFETAFKKIDAMDADKVKQYLKDLIKNNMTVGIEIIKDK